MTRRSIVRRRFSVLATALALSSLTACGSSGGPLQTAAAGGQPNFDVAWSFEVPGQPAEMTAYLVNSAPGQDPVTLVSASPIPISGHPTGRLVGVAVARDHDGVAAAGRRGADSIAP